MGWLEDAFAEAMLREQSRRVPQHVVSKEEALAAVPGRATAIDPGPRHAVTGAPLQPPFPAKAETIVLALGCFWGAEKWLWEQQGVLSTAVGYAGGWSENPSYEEVCTGKTGHTEAVLVVYDPAQLELQDLLVRFFEAHDPTSGHRQGNDIGTQYRSAIYTTTAAQEDCARRVAAAYAEALNKAGYGAITTEIGQLAQVRGGKFYYAEDYHQQYLAKNPGGYCPVHATGVRCGPVA